MDDPAPAVARGNGASQRLTTRSLLIAVGLLAVSGLVFAIDLSLRPGYVGALSYVVVMIASVFFNRVWLTVMLTVVGAAGTALAMAIKDPLPGATTDVVIFNRTSAVALVVLAGIGGVLLIRRGQRLHALSKKLTIANSHLKRQDRLVSAASEIGRIGGWSVDLSDGSVEWSSEIATIHGFGADEPLTWDQVVARYVPEDQARLTDAFNRCATEGVSFAEQYRVQAADGSLTWIMCVGEPLRDADGSIVGIHGAKQDVTAWKQAEDDAATVQHRFEQLTRSLPFIVWMGDRSGVADYFNDEFLTYTGKPLDELLNDQWLALVHPEDAGRAYAKWAESRARGDEHDDTYRVMRADGKYLWHQIRAVAEKDEQGEVVRWWGTAIDVHDRVELSERAETLATERENILESIGDSVFTVDRNWRFTYLNSNAAQSLSSSIDDLIGTEVWTEFPEAKDTQIYPAYQRVMQGGKAERFTEYYEPLGKWFEINVNPHPDGITVYFRDVTEFRSLTDQLQQAQRLEVVGRLTGGIAHDFNNLLTVVIGGAESLEMDESALSPAGREMVSMISHAAKRGAELTHHLLAFARRQPLAPHAVDTSDRVAELVPLLRRTLGDGVTVDTAFEDDLPFALVDPAQLDSALLNLCLNSRDAMPDGGTLTVETSSANLDQTYATAHGEVEPGRYIVVSVADSGTGIAPEHLSRLFDPFFTTKPVGEGTGLGLPMVWGFAKQSGGHVTVYSEVGHGTVFRLYLPLAPSGAEVSGTIEVTTDDDFVGTGTVLLVEDDMLVQQFATQQLRQSGYRVVVASSGPDALEVLDDIGHLDLLFTDVIMPGGMTGRQLADEVLTRRPGTPVLFTSGYTENVILHNGRLDEGVALLEKPYSSRQLVSMVRATMARTAGHAQ